MRKLLLILALLLLGATKSYAIAIPEAENPAEGPALWIVPVYNAEASTTLDVGDVVVWDIGSSTGDNDNYVKSTTTADTALVAGVIYGADIAAGGVGNMVVHGVVDVDSLTTSMNTVGGLACTSTTGGSAKTCDTQANAFGIITQVQSGGSAKVYVRGLQ